MSYTINKTNGQLLINLLDGTADGPDINPGLNVSDINFFGKNYPNYGQYQNENFVKLLQNFSGGTQPANPLSGELWYDTSTGFLRVYNGSSFTPVFPQTVSNIQPSGSKVGDQWWDTGNDQFKSYNGNTWITVGPAYSKASGITGAISSTIIDTQGHSHVVVELYTAGNITAIVSQDPVFTPNVSMPGFTTISPGITTSTSNSAGFNGTSTNALALSGISVSQLARTDISTVFQANLSVSGGLLSLGTTNGNVSISNSYANGSLDLVANVNGNLVSVLHVDGTTGSAYVLGLPTAPAGIANKSYVDAAVSNAAGYLAPLNSPVFTGAPTAPTRSSGDSSGNIATTAFTQTAVTNGIANLTSTIGNIYATVGYVNSVASLLAPLNSPVFIGTPTAPTRSSGDSSGNIATTAFTQAAISTSTNSLWQGSSKFISNVAPSNATGNIGDFWFQI